MAGMDEARPVVTARASGSVERQADLPKIRQNRQESERGEALGLWGLDFARGFYAVANGNVRPLTRTERRWAGRMAKRRARHV